MLKFSKVKLFIIGLVLGGIVILIFNFITISRYSDEDSLSSSVNGLYYQCSDCASYTANGWPLIYQTRMFGGVAGYSGEVIEFDTGNLIIDVISILIISQIFVFLVSYVIQFYNYKIIKNKNAK